MELATAKRIVKKIEKEGGEATLRENYSGRGMYGAVTAGVVFKGSHYTFTRKYRSDNMGMDTIIY